MQTLTPPASEIEPAAVAGKASAENFAVASRLLPARVRAHLLSTYAYARYIDDLGDLSVGDRLGHLEHAEQQLRSAMEGGPSDPLFVDAARTAHACRIGIEPYLALIEANKVDQRVGRYETFAQLEGYCALSANPVGRIVLGIFDVRDEAAEQLSDRVCTGLQLVEHWQDLAEDYAAGRVYLPREDLARFGVDEDAVGDDAASPALRRVLAFEVRRAKELIEAGRPLLGYLGGFGKVAVAGFIGGGLAQIEAIEACAYDTLAHRAKASKAAVALTSARVLAKAGRSRR